MSCIRVSERMQIPSLSGTAEAILKALGMFAAAVFTACVWWPG